MKKKVGLFLFTLALLLGSASIAFATVSGSEEKEAAKPSRTATSSEGENKDITYEVTTLHSVTSGEAVVGARLQILDKDGNIKADWVTDGKDFELTAELIAGETYTLHEVSAPAGYIKAADQTFTVGEDGSVDEIVMQDDYTKVELLKISAKTGEPLAGAHLQVLAPDGEVVLDWVTDGTAVRVDGLLAAGVRYTLHEVSAPAGYVKAADQTFTVGEDGELQKITMVNDYTKIRIRKVVK